MDAVTPAASVDGFFYEVLTESLEAVHVRATEPAGWYLVSLMGANVEITLEIQATVPDGVPENVIRIVTENARTLKFDQSGFEES